MPDQSIDNTKSILVVDDEEMIRNFVSALLARSGYNIILAASGEEALQRARQFSGTIHLLLSNVQMTGISGVDLATKLYAERPGIKVMLMSGFTSGMLLLNEGWHFIQKPFIPSRMRELIAGLLATDADPIPELDEPRQHKLEL